MSTLAGKTTVAIGLARALATIITPIVLGACAPPPALEWQAGEPRTTSVMFADRSLGLEALSHEHATRAGEALVERTSWASSAGATARTHLVTISAQSKRVFTTANRKPIVEEVESAWHPAAILFGAPRPGQNTLGEFESVRFESMAQLECVAVRQYFGENQRGAIERFRGEPLGRNVLRGWYCAKPGTALSDEQVSAFLNGYRLAP